MGGLGPPSAPGRPPASPPSPLGLPAGQEVDDGLVGLGLAVVPGHDAPGPVAVEAAALGLGGDLGRPLGVDLQHLIGDAGDGPVAQAPRGAVVGNDAVAQSHGLAGGCHPADHGGGMHVLAPQGGVGFQL